MPFKFNPFSGNFDQTGSGGGGGGSAFFAGEVATYADLPLDGTAALNSRWLVRSNSGTWPFSSYKQAGVYVRIATVGSSRDNDYRLTDTSFHDVMSDEAFVLFDNGDATKNLKFQLSGITTGTTRTLTVPDANGTLARTEDFASPPAIGNTTPNTGAFTTLTASGTTELVNGTNAAGPFRLYNTFTSATNHERGFLRWSSNVFQIGTEKGSGGGTARALEFHTDGTNRFDIATNGNISLQGRTALRNSQIFEVLGGSFLFATVTAGDSAVLARDALGTLALRNGTQPHTLRIYNTVSGTGNVNFDRVNFRWASNEFIIDAEAGGTGTLRGIKIGSATSSLLGFYGVTPVDQPATVTDPAGGGTVDAEARTAINAIIDRLQELGLIA